MNSTLRMADCMTKSPLTVDRTTSLAAALKIMEDKGFRHLPVVAGKRLLGVVSERELRCLENMRGFDSAGCTVEDCTLGPTFTVPPDALVSDVAREMAERKVGSAVVADGEEVVGLFTTVDAMRVLADVLSASP
jgi:acetoin utilization protein AcuB